jgi:class 3 adenylate cyclase/tetratricopeptide (TPR) repeat protein
MRFCGYCGIPLSTDSVEAAAELRQLTALFCDLVGSTSLAESLDPEDYREVIRAYRAACVTVIGRHDGRVKQYVGDGVLAYFGYPVAHEDDARRAVRAGLEIIAALAALNADWHSGHRVPVIARVGIHTGLVVVSEIESSDFGKTLNLASRIQNIAASGAVVVSDDTYRITRGFFDFTPLGAHEIKGLSEVVSLHQVLQESGAVSRLDVARRVGLTPLTGRDKELALLEQRWRSVSSEGGHAVLVYGEPGIGKSRIVDALRERVDQQSATVFECSCTPYAQSTPLFPIVELAERTLGFTRETPDSDKRAALEERLATRGLLTEETAALMAGLLSIPSDDADPLVNYSPQKRRERTLETLLAWLLAVAHERPTLWVVEDLHWADPTTLEFVGSALGSLSAQPLLAILTFRPGFAVPWHPNGHVSSMMLTRLAPDQTSAMAARVAHNKTIPADVLKQIVSRAEGVPLYVEEVTKAVLELGVLVEREDRFEISGPLPPDLIPSTVQGSLDARLDRLGPAKATAQLAAAIGREFGYALLSAVADETETKLRRSLGRLIEAELVYRRSDLLEETYLFKHALVRDAAYGSLLKKSRRALHERIGEVLISRFPETAKQQPELVAEHFSAAGCADQAVKFWLLSGQLAVSRGANHEAIAHLNRGRLLVSELPETKRLQQELELLVALIPALIAAEGWASAELERIVQRAQVLVDILGDTPHRFTVLSTMFGNRLVGGRVPQSLVVAKQTLELGTRTGNRVLMTMARQNCTAAHLYCGDFRLAMEHAEAGLAMLDLDRERLIGRMVGYASCVGLLAHEMNACWMLGFPERSARAAERCVALAHELGHPPSLGFALTAKTSSCHLQRHASRTLESAEETLRLVREEHLGFWEPMITVFRGWALSELGDPEAGIAQIRAAIERYRAAGNGVELGRFHVILAGAQWRGGQWNDAFNTLATAMTIVKENGEGLFEPELYRLEGQFRCEQAIGAAGPSKSAFTDDRPTALAHAERCIRESLDRARRQQARMLELRSLVSLCCVQKELGTVPPEYDALTETYNAFTEGFDFPDLREARSMLEAVGIK